MRERLTVALFVTAVFAVAPAAALARLRAGGSVRQVYVTGASPGERLALLSRRGTVVGSQVAGSLGGAIFRGVSPAPGYRVRGAGGGGGAGSMTPAVTVLPDRSAPPSTRIYDQRIPASGYGYLTTRDGTKLAIDVRLPGGPGPYPTVIEYSGYGYADPAGAQSGISPVATLLGFAVVDVNMRGTGCSGGAFSFFEPLQSLDGYDVIETVAHQPWVLHHKVGMIGISYGGISQLFVAATDPPDLAAITPLSVIDNTATTLYPGGILNTGFGVPYAKARDFDAEPASPGHGEAWALQRIQGGDRTCRANQVLHTAAVNEVAETNANRYYVPSVANPLNPDTFVHKIHVPVFLACQWTDEQTGGHCPELAEHFTGTRLKWFTFTNGAHIDSLDPATALRWYDFLSLFVGQSRPALSPGQLALAPELYQVAMGVSGVTFPPDPIEQEPDYASALAAFEAQPPIRILFDNGAGTSTPGVPGAAFEQSFASFPVPGTVAQSWYLGGDGALSASASPAHGVDAFTWLPKSRPATDFTGNTGAGGLWGTSPNYHWAQNPAGTALSYLTAPLTQNLVVVGAGALHVWVRASTPDVDLQVTVSEVRPDGNETFVQSGWLDASERKLSAQSTLLEPLLTERKADVRPLPRRRFTELVVPLYYEGHVYRAGSRIRITISAPGGDQPTWAFTDLTPAGRATVRVAHSPAMPSRLILPVVPGVAVPTGLPPCPGLRGEPCRRYVPIVNRAVS
ncbi:MAG TPA: CocE/NonD family hydrolase [Solirubrobacteraceae bacterium]|nr:CocE/NonD family hydrolase [Solirubrobacteraceae bacterium]